MTIDRDSAAEKIAQLIHNELDDIQRAERKLFKPTEDPAVLALRNKESELIILTYMLVARELGLFDDVVRRVTIPPRLMEDFRGPDHPLS